MGKQVIDEKRLGNYFSILPEDLTIVGMDTDDGPEHPLYDKRVEDTFNDESFIAGVMLGGIIEPLIITKEGTKKVVVCGRHRARAAREANARLKKAGKAPIEVPCRYCAPGTEASTMIKMIIENEHRRNDSLERKIENLERLLGFGATKKEAAIAFRVTTATIDNWCKLASAPKELREKVFAGDVPAKQVIQHSGKSRKEQLEEAKKSENEPRVKRGRPKGPSRKTLGVLVQSIKQEGKHELHPEFVRAIMWVTGQIGAEEAGVEALIGKKGGKK